jgi:hypothetical protein
MSRSNLPKNLRPMLSQQKSGNITIIQNGRNVVIPETGYAQKCASFQAAERLVANLVKSMQAGQPLPKPNPCAVGMVCAPRRKVSRSALRRGTRVEMEHTRNRKVAEVIARVHLAERADYYPRLAEMERNPRMLMRESKWVGAKLVTLDGEYIAMVRPRLLREYGNMTIARRIFNTLETPSRLRHWMTVTDKMQARGTNRR